MGRQIAGVRPGWTVPYGSSHYNDNNRRSCTICLVWRSHIYLRPLRLHMGAPFLLAPPWASSIAASARSTPFGLLPSPLRRTLVSATSSSPCPPCPATGGLSPPGVPNITQLL